MDEKSASRNQRALRRLVARCPFLLEDPLIVPLMRKGYDLEDGDMLAVSKELILRPNLTVPVAGCFCHILSQMVGSAIESLCQVHSNCNNENSAAIEPDKPRDFWNLAIHEYAIMAFSRILELAPHLLSIILRYFSFAPPPLERLVNKGVFGAQPTEKGIPSLLDIVRATYRLVLLEPTTFQDIWDWTPILDLLQWKDGEHNLLPEATFDVRWCAVQILSCVMRMSDEAIRIFSFKMAGLTEEESFSCLIRWKDFCEETAVEKAGWYMGTCFFQSEYAMSLGVDQCPRNLDEIVGENQCALKWKSWTSSGFACVEICGIELPTRKNMTCVEGIPPYFSNSFVPTAAVRKNLQAVVLALSQKQPVLLEGPFGVGKTNLIKELAHLTGNSDLIFIHLDDQMDNKALLGSYVCTEIPGEFRWQPGALTQAVMKGLWVVLEDIDNASSEFLSVIVPLLEGRKLYIPGHVKMVSAAENFQLFATVSKSKFGSPNYSPGKKVLNNLWRKVVIDAPNDFELETIIGKSFPLLASLASKLTGTVSAINGIYPQSASHVDVLYNAAIFVGRQFTIRDIMKWCKRIMASGLSKFDSTILSNSVCEIVYIEGIDCFAGAISCVEIRRLVMRTIAELWHVPEEQVDFLENLNKPMLQRLPSTVQIGRAVLPICIGKEKNTSAYGFASTTYFMRVLERIAVCVQHQEPVLLVGETGTGKTTLIQYLAHEVSIPLCIVNLSRQSESADLLGGFKPIEAQNICLPLLERFIYLFCLTFPSQKNAEFLLRVHQFAEKKKWGQLLKAFEMAVAKVKQIVDCTIGPGLPLGKAAGDVLEGSERVPIAKRHHHLSSVLVEKWHLFSTDLIKCKRQVEAAKTTFSFTFVEGSLVMALRQGHWVLLDEVNLAPMETLERLTGILDGERGSLCLTERGDIQNIPRHPNFRLFACMNPATDVGKHNLPFSMRNRFTEFYVDELTNKDDLHNFVYQYMKNAMPSPPVESIVTFYQQARQYADTRLFDSGNQKPHYSLRSLSRALEYTLSAMPIYGFQRALYDGICMTFLTHLDQPSVYLMESLITSLLLNQPGLASNAMKSHLKVPIQPSPNHVLFEQFWIEKGDLCPSEFSVEFCNRYVLTRSRREHLKNIARAVFVHKYPVLLQGPTSSGKTSLIEYLATVTSHKFVRINNHEHTDLQEYVGSYSPNASGKLVFQEGALVKAVCNGHWIVLDELNLAPSDVLEALNRLLDDNRELYIPELQKTVKPHPHFMLFATQNPAGVYGGRKVLSRAFRNRFLELHIDDIPEDEICSILEKRCEIPASYSIKMVAVMRDLQRHRQSSKVFAGKHGFITPRDLFRWGDRHRKSGISYEDLAKDGYMLLAERLRDNTEKNIVLQALERNLHVKIDVEQLYEQMSSVPQMQEMKKLLALSSTCTTFGKIVWTKSMKRLFALVERAYEHGEPILLIGETGCGKTTVCQLLAIVHAQHLHILNCHQHTETSDFLGGFHPVRDRETITKQFADAVNNLNSLQLFCEFHKGKLPTSIGNASSTLSAIRNVIMSIKDHFGSGPHTQQLETSLGVEETVAGIESIEHLLIDAYKKWQSLFVWHDGTLVEAMRNGDLFVVDEISLADDSVLERLNSVLEPKRLLVLPEKGGANLEEINAHPKFLLMATMNPGGDFGKKELSPALRNRFTEIWVPPISDFEDLRSIVTDRCSRPDLTCLVDPLLNFLKWYRQWENTKCVTVRDLLSWITFIKSVEHAVGKYAALLHGAFLVLLDGIGVGSGISHEVARGIKKASFDFLLQQIHKDEELKWSDEHAFFAGSNKVISCSSDMFGIDPFYIPKGENAFQRTQFELSAPTTSTNVFRILRAMQLQKPILLEGSPGVGKTSLVTALANASGHSVIRINLSEQTDLMDLLGSDLPIDSGNGLEFCWSDGVFLQALRAGHWVLLDELNLASQSVLEGLNACLDHRGEVFIPELGRCFKCPQSFRVFGCQNPSNEGGGRKGLPRSFMNRFTKVYVDALCEDDLLFISSSLHPSIPRSLLHNLIHFNSRVYKEIVQSHGYGQCGALWEFNLRDILRSCILIEGLSNSDILSTNGASCFLDVVYLQRMRSVDDRHHVLRLYSEIFGTEAAIEAFPTVNINSKHLVVGNACLERVSGPSFCLFDVNGQLQLLPGQTKCLECVMHCVHHGWMCILVGPSASGKTSLIRSLAKLTGNSLHEFTLCSGTDMTELLGCFEQYDVSQAWQNIVDGTQQALQEVSSLCLTSSGQVLPLENSIKCMKMLLAAWSTFHKCLVVRHHVSSWPSTYWEQSFNDNPLDPLAVELLTKVLQQLENVVSNCGTSTLMLSSEIESLVLKLEKLKKNSNEKVNAGHFQWVDGDFLEALQHGEWVLLENANSCNPTVLDRLNSLLEPNGTILVNERGVVSGSAMVVKAHPNFRIFLTVDPSEGEVSRAMRNRGVEIYMMQPYWLISDFNTLSPAASELVEIKRGVRDANRFLVLSGLPDSILINTMCKAHADMAAFLEASYTGHHVSLRHLSQWARLLQQLIARGAGLTWSLYHGWEQTYACGLDIMEARHSLLSIFKTHLGNLAAVESSCLQKQTWHVAGGWPHPLNLTTLSRMSVEAAVMRDCMHFELLVVEQVASKMLTEVSKSKIKGEALISWLEKRKGIVSCFPKSLLCLFLYPLLDVPNETGRDEMLQSGVVDCEQMLIFAAIWMMEQASLSDRKLRLQWLESLSVKLGSYEHSLKRLVTAFRKEFCHPLTMKFISAVEDLKNSAVQGSFIGMQAYCFMQTVSSTKPVRLRQVCSLSRKLCALRRLMIQWEIEDEVLGQTGDSSFSRTEPMLLQSYRYQTFSSLQRQLSVISGDLVNCLYPLFMSLRKLEEKAVTLDSFPMWDIRFCTLFRRLEEWHQTFWKILCEPELLIAPLTFCWKKVKYSVNLLIQSLTLPDQDFLKVIDEFLQMGQCMDAALCQGGACSRPLLWKYGGHPPMPRSKENFEKHQQVLEFCHALWPSAVQGHLLVSATIRESRFLHLLLEGVSMMNWIIQGGLDHKLRGGKEKIVVCDSSHELEEIHKMLKGRLEVENAQIEKFQNCKWFMLAKIQATYEPNDSGCKCCVQHSSKYPVGPEVLFSAAAKNLWLRILPWLDYSSLCKDAEALTKVLPIAAQFTVKREGIDRFLKQLQVAREDFLNLIDFSLKLSSRSPLDFVPHQQLLWLMDANSELESLGLDCMLVQAIIHEIWFNWHAAVWRDYPECDMGKLPGFWTAIEGPARLFHALQSSNLANWILLTATAREYHGRVLQLRVLSERLWCITKTGSRDILELDFERASAVLLQIIFSHWKSFKNTDMDEMKCLLISLHGKSLLGSEIDIGSVKRVEALLKSSNHVNLASLTDAFIMPCMKLLYDKSGTVVNSMDSLFVRGKIWLLLGSIRIRLLLCNGSIDPMSKYSHEHAYLFQQLKNLKLELKVRQESDLLIRGGINAVDTREFLARIQELEQKLTALSLRVVYRPTPCQVTSLYKAVHTFMESVARSSAIARLIDALQEPVVHKITQQTIQEVINFQGNSMNFISRLSRDYVEYRDIVQPVQLSIFEMKYGVSLMLAASIRKQFWMKGGPKCCEQHLVEIISSLMEFPTRPKLCLLYPTIASCHTPKEAEVMLSSKILNVIQLLEYTLCEAADRGMTKFDQKVLNCKMKSAILQLELSRCRNDILGTCLLRRTSLECLDELLIMVKSLWMEVQESLVSGNEEWKDAIQFRQRAHWMGFEMDENEAFFQNMFPDFLGATVDGDYSKVMEDKNEKNDETNSSMNEKRMLERTWHSIEYSLIKDVVNIHNRIFSSCDLVQIDLNSWLVSEDERFAAFVLAYDAGTLIFEVMGHSVPSGMEENIVPSHLLRICMEHEKLVSNCYGSQSESTKFNIYKDSCASEIAMMLGRLADLEDHIDQLLSEWPEQPILQQLMQMIESLASFTVDVPLIKVLNCVEQIIAKAQLWEENAPRHLSLIGELNGLSCIVARWRKIELQCLQVFLHYVEEKHNMSADKLWFFLHGVFYRRLQEGKDSELEATIECVDEFLQIAPLGEFKRRLDILNGFRGQFHLQSCLGARTVLSSDMLRQLSNVLYGIIKYYSQFLPLITETIQTGKMDSENELKGMAELCKWDGHNYYSLADSTDKSHRKIRQVVCKFDEVMRQPVHNILKDNGRCLGLNHISSLEQSSKIGAAFFSLDKPIGNNGMLNKFVASGDYDKTKGIRVEKLWEMICEFKINKLSRLVLEEPDIEGLYHTRLQSIVERLRSLLSSYVFSDKACEIRQNGTQEFERLGGIVIARSSELRKHEKRRSVKKKALVDLLKTLRDIGLSHRKSAIPKEARSMKSWFQQPPSEVSSLFEFWLDRLQKGEANNVISAFGVSQLKYGSLKWNRADDYYFKNMALVHQLRENSLNFNKDLTMREVTMSAAFVEHLLHLQHQQRHKAHNFTLTLVSLQNVISLLGSFGIENAYTRFSQGSLRKWMWLQKDLLDALFTTSVEVSLFLKMVKTIQVCPFSRSECEAGKLKDEFDKIVIAIQNCKNDLDSHLVPGTHLFSIYELESTWPVLITPQMVNTVTHNFSVLLNAKRTFDDLCADLNGTDGVAPLFKCLQELLCKVFDMSEDFNLMNVQKSDNLVRKFSCSKDFVECYDKVISEILIAVQALQKVSGDLTLININDGAVVEQAVPFDARPQASLATIEEQMSALRLKQILDTVQNAISVGVEWLDPLHNGSDKSFKQCGLLLGCIHDLLEFILLAGMVILVDYISMAKSVAKLCYILANVFNSLYCDGFCSAKDLEGDEVSGIKDATGTGMGEGEGQKDVSNQIEDEDQLLGISEKTRKKDHTSETHPESGDKGIEMEHDFEANLEEVSLDISDKETDDDESENEDEQFDSKMGEQGENEEIVDEKLWGNDYNDGTSDYGKEKYEPGPPVQDSGAELELRAKEMEAEDHDSADADEGKEGLQNGQALPQELSELQGDEREDSRETTEFEKMDAYEDPSGTNPSAEEFELPQDMELDSESEDALPVDEEVKGVSEDAPDAMDLESRGDMSPVCQEPASEKDEIREDLGIDKNGKNGLHEQNELAGDKNAKSDSSQHLQPSHKEQLNLDGEHTEAVPRDVSFASSSSKSKIVAALFTTPMDPPSAGNETTMLQQSNIPDELDVDQQIRSTRKYGEGNILSYESSVYDHNPQTLERMHANPYRTLGDAIRDWKERVRINSNHNPDQTENENAGKKLDEKAGDLEEGEEYEFAMENEDSSAQALGAATSEQVDQIKQLNAPQVEKHAMGDEDGIVTDHPEILREGCQNSVRTVKPKQIRESTEKKVLAQIDIDYQENSHADCEDMDNEYKQGKQSLALENTVSVRTGIFNLASKAAQPWTEEEIQNIRKELDMRLREENHSLEEAKTIWIKYEQITTRISQQLVEQLRLIMEPTLATRFAGDYKTGKRINMKKVIPYIASQFRKDKIWLRRTRPSKRQYQVVLAIDDSRSMSESHCGHMALEALIIICRAMSTLEVGQMAVTSFGKKGNVNLIHDFNQPFSNEVGIRLISQFSFKQENTISDEPMVDLLQYLTRMLDTVALQASVPSGHSNLQQLVLIIADGRFHEKESLRRCIREALSRRQLLAFVLLDNPQESIMDVQSVSFSSGKPTFSKYLDSFPFPYYIVLKDLEALPQTLADLLRQWFELMQHAYIC